MNWLARRTPERYLGRTMTAKEKLRQRIETLTEEEAAEALRLLDQRPDPLTALLDTAPIDDEPVTPEEDEAVAEARAEIARGEGISAEEIRREFAGAASRAAAGSPPRAQDATCGASIAPCNNGSSRGSIALSAILRPATSSGSRAPIGRAHVWTPVTPI